MRKSIFDLLNEKYDINREFQVVVDLFKNPTVFMADFNETKMFSIERVINDRCFHFWKQRGSCLSTSDIKKKLGLDHCDTSILNNKIYCLEYISNMINLANTKLSASYFQKLKEFVILEQNLDILLEHLNYEKVIFTEDEKVILIPKNPAATAVAEISSKGTSLAILKYNHASLKGQLEEKRQLLLSIANEYEPLLNKPIEGFNDYFTKATNMLNNVHIRHNNKSGKNKKELVANMSDEDLENWYDETYQLLLFCVLIKDNKDRKDKLDELLKKVNYKSDKKVQRKE